MKRPAHGQTILESLSSLQFTQKRTRQTKDMANALLNRGLGVITVGRRVFGAIESAGRGAASAAADVVVPAVLAEILARVDLTELVRKNVDLDALAETIDVDAIAYRLDLLGLARYIIDGIDLPEIIRESTQGVTSDAVRGARIQAIDADQAVARVVDRLLLRHGRRETTTGDVSAPTADVSAP